MNCCLSILPYIKRNKRSKIEVFESICAVIFTHRHTCINKDITKTTDESQASQRRVTNDYRRVTDDSDK